MLILPTKAIEQRPCCLTGVAGARFTGKSNETLRTCYSAANGDASKGIKPKNVIIFDSNNEYDDYKYYGKPHSIPRIWLKDIPTLTKNPYAGQIFRVAPYWDSNRRMLTMQDKVNGITQILQTYKNGVFLIEDLNKVVGDQLPDELVSYMATLRQSGLDIIIHYQNIGRLGQPRMLGNLNTIRLHRTKDSVTYHAGKFQDFTNMLSIAQSIVEKKYFYGMEHDIRALQTYSLHVDLDHGKIRGAITRDEASEAIRWHMANNHSKLIKPYLNMYDEKGKAMYDKQTAHAEVQHKFMSEYFSFKNMKVQ